RVPAVRCGKCEEVYLDGPSLGRFDLEVAGRLAGLGSSEPAAFRFMRKAIGMPAEELARWLNVTPMTVSRWENGKVPLDRGALVVLGGMVEDRLNRPSRRKIVDRIRAILEYRAGKRQTIAIKMGRR